MEPERRKSPRIAVVGPCASGKSTLVANLKARGHDAYAVAQEHSAVKYLWSRQNPDVLIALDVSLEVVRQRRSPQWLEAIYERQHERLQDAYVNADVIIDSDSHNAEEVVGIAEDLIRSLDS